MFYFLSAMSSQKTDLNLYCLRSKIKIRNLCPQFTGKSTSLTEIWSHSMKTFYQMYGLKSFFLMGFMGFYVFKNKMMYGNIFGKSCYKMMKCNRNVCDVIRKRFFCLANIGIPESNVSMKAYFQSMNVFLYLIVSSALLTERHVLFDSLKMFPCLFGFDIKWNGFFYQWKKETEKT